MKHWQAIIAHIEQSSGLPFVLKQQTSIAGGSINDAFLLSAEDGRQYFIKTHQIGQKAMFAAEASGLQAIIASQTLKAPLPLCFGEDKKQSYIVLEYLALSARADQHILGQQLAAMHQNTAEQFGWQMHNTIGATPQSNTWTANWLDFWAEHRLGFQLRLAAQNGYTGKLQSLGELLLLEMPALFTGRQVQASMLHGDLWGGNVAGLSDGTPVIYDPAFYYGDREADLAMTYVFGGFDADFYASYQNVLPLDEGFVVRKTFYNIYHIINHLNLFGGGYQQQAIAMLEQVLSEIK